MMKTNQPLSQDVNRRTARMEWTFWFSLGSLLMTGGLALAKHFGDGPTQLTSGQHIRTFYVAVLAYTYGAFPVTALALMACALLAAVWILRLRQATGRKRALAAVSVALVALLWASWSTLPLVFVGYQHLTSTVLGADSYHLGVRKALDGDDYFVISKCLRGQLSCDAYGIALVEQADRTNLAAVRLETQGASNALSIHTATQTIPVTLPTP
jgi:hypothetical protein